MKRILIIGLFFICYLLHSCASIPSSSSTLTKEVLKEADQMHALNIALINELYSSRQERINDFITNQYTPKLLANFEKQLPDSLNYKDELPNILKSIVPVINAKRDSIQNILSKEQEKVIAQVNANYNSFKDAGTSLQNLIDSAVKLKSEEQQAIGAIQKMTHTNIHTEKIENTLNSLLLKSGDDFAKLLEVKSIINQ